MSSLVSLPDSESTCATCSIAEGTEQDTSFTQDPRELLTNRVPLYDSTHLRNMLANIAGWRVLWHPSSDQELLSSVWSSLFTKSTAVFRESSWAELESEDSLSLVLQARSLLVHSTPISRLASSDSSSLAQAGSYGDSASLDKAMIEPDGELHATGWTAYLEEFIGSYARGHPHRIPVSRSSSSAVTIPEFSHRIGWRKSELLYSREANHYLAARPILDHIVRIAIRKVENQILLDERNYDLSIELTQDPECEGHDLRMLIESDDLSFDEMTDLWELTSRRVHEAILRFASENNLSEGEVNSMLDMFTISVQPTRRRDD